MNVYYFLIKARGSLCIEELHIWFYKFKDLRNK